MIRYGLICSKVLELYKRQSMLRFPIDPCSVIERLPNCRVISYSQLAEWNGSSLDEVIRLNESKAGCTHYECATGRYLILWNDDPSDNNVPGRQRWTQAHELGHVMLDHLPMSKTVKLAETRNQYGAIRELEEEADQFAATFLCPTPLYRALNIYSAADIMNVFGLSEEASNIRWSEYIRFRGAKRAPEEARWEDNMRSILTLRKRAGKLQHPPFRYDHPRYSGIDVWREQDEVI